MGRSKTLLLLPFFSDYTSLTIAITPHKWGLQECYLHPIFALVKRFITILATFIATTLAAQEVDDTLYRDIEGVEITASLKGEEGHKAPISSTTLNMRRLEERGIGSVKDISLVSPNFYQPDYGSSITSSIYVRGFGSRIDQPVLGVVIDNVPVMNKNAFDFDFYDIRRIELMRGPQGTLYGRNTSGGVMNITTLSPIEWQGLRAMAEYSIATSYRASAAYYARPNERFGVSFAAAFDHDGGHFRNIYRDEICDRGNSGSARLRLVGNSGRWHFDNTLSVGYTREGGYAYHHYIPELHTIEPVAYNDPSGYERLTINEGFTARYDWYNITLTSVTSYQYLDDTMTLDQDFSPKSMFTMQQMQREHTVTEEVVIRNKVNNSRWQWLAGTFLFAKWLDMSSPVTFKEDGINELILGNINKGIHSVFPNNNMLFGTDSFVINSDFNIPTYGAALYGQTSVDLGQWRLTAGLRFDFEHASMSYNSNAVVPYRFDMTMEEFKDLYTEFKGRESDMFFEILPKIAAQYRFLRGNVYATITRGYKAGGYNTQIFSDILQNMMMNGLMADLGVYLDDAGTAVKAEDTAYRPEKAWNYEIGANIDIRNTGHFHGAASVFLINCKDQQITLFPPGKSTGRMMANVGRSRSVGAEASASYEIAGLAVYASYGYTDARFTEYDNGNADYSGNRIPYSPEQTFSARAGYTFSFHKDGFRSLSINADCSAIGRIWWDEANTLVEPAVIQLGTDMTLGFKWFDLRLRMDNLTNEDYNVFYFKSVGNSFFQRGKPFRWTAGIRINL